MTRDKLKTITDLIRATTVQRQTNDKTPSKYQTVSAVSLADAITTFNDTWRT